LLTLNLAGNDLKTLENVESAHFTFTLLQKIDLSNNKWSCKYLLSLIKIFRVYKVVMTLENVEEGGTNIHGVKCEHFEGEDDLIEPLSQSGSNLTEIRDKMNELIGEVSKNTQFKNSIEARLSRVEGRIDNQVMTSSALQSEKSSQVIEVKNSSLLETVLVLSGICLLVVILFKCVVYIKQNFLGQPKKMRAASERHLAMCVDDF